MNKTSATAQIVRFLEKELNWQLDYSRGGIFKDNQTSGLFFFVCPYHEISKEKPSLDLWAYTMFYYPKKEKQFSCKCGMEFKNVYEIWSREKQVDLETAVREVNYLIENKNYTDDYEQLPQYKPSYGTKYRIKKELIKKNVYENNQQKNDRQNNI